MELIVTPALRLTLTLLAYIEPEYVSDFLLSLIMEINGEDHAAVEDMPEPVAAAFKYWNARRDQIT